MRNLLSTALILTAFAPGLAFAQSSDPAWLDELKDQLALEKQCNVILLMNMREGELGGELTYEARVKCEDGRMFDASRTGKGGLFDLKTCEIQTC